MANIVSVRLVGSLLLQKAGTARVWRDEFGQGVELPSGLISYKLGTGVGFANMLGVISYNITPSSSVSIDLASSSFQNVVGDPLVFTKLKLLYIEHDSPIPSGNFWVGPQGVANGLVSWWDGVGPGARTKVQSKMLLEETNGYVVSPSSKVIQLLNDSLAAVPGKIVLLGE